jgi:hypothetical protein
MPLPVLNTPIYELTIPSTKKTVKYRPFLVKEEKALMIAQQSEDEKVMLNTTKEIIKSCILDKVDPDKLALFDIEYIFLQLRGKSVGEISELLFSCNECKDPKAKYKYSLDITKIDVQFDEGHSANIKLFGEVGVKMKYPSFSLASKVRGNENSVESIFEVIMSCIDSIYDEDQVYPAIDQSKEELENFINNLTQEQFAKIQSFFETMPKLEHTVKWKCPVCSFNHTHVLRGLENFF